MVNFKWNQLRGLPHKNILFKNDIVIEQLSLDTQDKINQFNTMYANAMKYGIDQQTKNKMWELSENIANAIIAEHEAKQQKSSVSPLGILAVVGLVVGAAFGVNQMMRN